MFLVLTTPESHAARAGRTQRPLWAAVIAEVFAADTVVAELVRARPGSGRSGDSYDALADLVGIARGCLAYRRVRDRWVPRRLLRQGAA